MISLVFTGYFRLDLCVALGLLCAVFEFVLLAAYAQDEFKGTYESSMSLKSQQSLPQLLWHETAFHDSI